MSLLGSDVELGVGRPAGQGCEHDAGGASVVKVGGDTAAWYIVTWPHAALTIKLVTKETPGNCGMSDSSDKLHFTRKYKLKTGKDVLSS